jgi:hypothetical protein
LVTFFNEEPGGAMANATSVDEIINYGKIR